MQARGLELHRLALHAYSYLHLPMVAGIVLFALGLKTTVDHVGEALDTVPAVGLCGGAALYLLGHIAFLFRTTGRVFRRRTVGRCRAARPHPGCTRRFRRSRRSPS